jgi:hypothetical protein
VGKPVFKLPLTQQQERRVNSSVVLLAVFQQKDTPVQDRNISRERQPNKPLGAP